MASCNPHRQFAGVDIRGYGILDGHARYADDGNCNANTPSHVDSGRSTPSAQINPETGGSGHGHRRIHVEYGECVCHASKHLIGPLREDQFDQVVTQA